MAFEIAIDAAQRFELFDRKGAGLGERGIQNRGAVAFREDEPIGDGASRIRDIVSHRVEEGHRDQIGG
jgi:hypothetical protein